MTHRDFAVRLSLVVAAALVGALLYAMVPMLFRDWAYLHNARMFDEAKAARQAAPPQQAPPPTAAAPSPTK